MLLNDKNTVSTWTIGGSSLSASTTRNNVLVLAIAVDNVQTTDGNTSLVTGVTDTGVTWNKAREFTNGQGAAAGGATIAVWWAEYGVNALGLQTGSSFAITFASAQVAKGVAGQAFSIPAGSTVALDTHAADLANDAADAGSITISGLTNSEHLFFRGQAMERAGVSTWTATSGWGANWGASSGTSGGSSVTNMQALNEYLIATATSATSDPTSTAVDQAGVLVALNEVVAATATPPRPAIVVSQAVKRAAYFCLGEKWARRDRLWVPARDRAFVVAAR